MKNLKPLDTGHSWEMRCTSNMAVQRIGKINKKSSRIFLPCALQKYGFAADPHLSLHTMSVNIKIVQAHSFPIDIVTTGDPW